MSARVDVVVVTFRSRTHLAAAAASLRTADDVATVTVVDNASDDGTAAHARSLDWGAPVRVIESTRNTGFGMAANAGVSAIESPEPYLLLLNPDASIEAAGLAQLVADLEADPRLGCVGAQLQRPTGEAVSSARDFPTLRSIVRRRPEEAVHDGRLTPADWVCGALMLWRRAAFDDVGGFSHRFFLYYEDTDVCSRAWAAGWSVAIDGGVVAHHDQGHGLRTPAHLRGHSRRSRRRYARRWLGWRGSAASVVADAAELTGSVLRAAGLRR